MWSMLSGLTGFLVTFHQSVILQLLGAGHDSRKVDCRVRSQLHQPYQSEAFKARRLAAILQRSRAQLLTILIGWWIAA